MTVHLLLTSNWDLDAWKRESDAERQPHHLQAVIRDEFSAVVYRPDPDAANLVDRLLSKACGTPGMWANARMCTKNCGDGDVVVASNEESALPAIAWLRLRRRKTRLVSSVMNPDRIRMKVLFRMLGASGRIDRFIAHSSPILEILRDTLHVPAGKLAIEPLETDIEFFRPLVRQRPSGRPLIYSAGLEQRDYRTLATALAGIDVDIEICAISPNATESTRNAFPDPIPANMRVEKDPWPLYRQKFADADVIVVPVLSNRYGAGHTTMAEGMACGRPVVITDRTGLPADLEREGGLVTVDPEDPQALRAAITRILDDPEYAAALGRRAREVAVARFSTDRFIERFSGIIATPPVADRVA